MFRLVFVFLTAANVAYAWALPPSLIPDGRIVGGMDANIDNFPYQVSLQLKISGSGSSHICGGSIYNNRTIVTAAHCVYGQYTSQLVIKAGITHQSESSPGLEISSLLYHADYSPHTLDYDVGLVILAKPLTYSDKIQPISLATINPDAATDVVVTGWGALYEGGFSSSNLQQVNVKVVDQQQCDDEYGGSITSRMICAGVPEGGKDACQGDSGGPMAAGDILVGIVSWGYGCARPSYPGIYSSVAALRYWIVKNAAI